MDDHAPSPGESDPDEYVAGDADPSAFVGEPPAGDATPDEYMSNDQRDRVSPDTGTAYSRDGEPESTPHDEEWDETTT